MDKFDSLIDKLKSSPISSDEFDNYLKRINRVSDLEIDLELLQFFGLPIVKERDSVYLKTFKNSFKDEEFCIVDIETNGSSPIKHQIIELGAIKYKNQKIVDRFSSLVYAEHIPDIIVNLTGIQEKDLKNAPSLKKVLHDFKLFLADSVFVAHNVKFDYNFISQSLKIVGIEELLNRRLCTVDLARKTIQADKHGLKFLKAHLNIEDDNHHRAYSDALSALKILNECFKNLPTDIKTTEELIAFATTNTKKKKKKKVDES